MPGWQGQRDSPLATEGVLVRRERSRSTLYKNGGTRRVAAAAGCHARP